MIYVSKNENKSANILMNVTWTKIVKKEKKKNKKKGAI